MNRYENYITYVMCSNCRKITRIKVPIGESIETQCCSHCGKHNLHHPSYFCPSSRDWRDLIRSETANLVTHEQAQQIAQAAVDADSLKIAEQIIGILDEHDSDESKLNGVYWLAEELRG